MHTCDYFLFVLQWGASYCSVSKCIGPPSASFTVHGLWPQFADGTYPSFCSGDPFTAALVEDLAPEMQRVWPSLTGKKIYNIYDIYIEKYF